MEGIVFKSTGSWYMVRQADGSMLPCKLKGNLRIQGITTTNPVAVGDRVIYEPTADGTIGIIKSVAERYNYIIRRATKLSKVSHIIASNIDQALLLATLAMPRTSTGFIDRFLVTSEAYHIPARIIFNKTDLYDDVLMERCRKLIGLYSGIGYTCFGMSALTGEGLDTLREVLKGKTSLLSGHSGVGKSAVINALEPRLNLKTADVSAYHQKGIHTTTFAEIFELSSGGLIIDTPGIKEFGLIDFEKAEVAERFPEMRALMHQCQYNNCTHVHEPRCAVKEALEKGKVDPGRYRNYLNILSGEWEESQI
jgi:ribosome biogenesis GTPase